MNRNNIIKYFFETLFVGMVILSLQTGYSQTPYILPGFPVNLGQGMSVLMCATPVVADFNKSGQNQILIGVNYSTDIARIYLVKSNGQIMPNWPRYLTQPNIATAAGDINNTGYIDVVVRTQDSVYVLNYFNQSLPGFPVYLHSQNLISQLALYDLDNDHKLEIITAGNTTDSISITVISSDGTIRQGWPKTVYGKYNAPFAVGDLNNDGIPEIIAPVSYCGQTGCVSIFLNVLEPSGQNFSGWPMISDSSYDYFSPAPTIFKQAGTDSSYIIINSNKHTQTDSFVTRTSKYNYKGDLIKRYYTSSEFENSSIALGDVNNDNQLEQLFGNDFDIYLYRQDGQMFSGWPIGASGFYYSAPLIAKLSNGINILYQWRSADSNGYGRIFVVLPNGNQLPWSPLRPWGIVSAIPTLCDLSNDGQSDMVFVTDQMDSTYLYAFSFPDIPYSHRDFPWPMYGHDRYRTFQFGFVPPDEPIGIKPISQNVPGTFKLYQNFPNPFNPTTKIKFNITSNVKPARTGGRETSNVKLIIYDVLGREAAILVNQQLKPGSYEVTFDGSNYASGLYFYRLQTDDFVDVKKMVIIK